MHRVVDPPSRSQTKDAIGGWLLTFVPRYKISGSTGTGVSHAGGRRPLIEEAEAAEER